MNNRKKVPVFDGRGEIIHPDGFVSTESSRALAAIFHHPKFGAQGSANGKKGRGFVGEATAQERREMRDKFGL